MMTHKLKNLFADKDGTSAIEFAIVGPVFLAMIIGLFYTCLMLFEMGSMQYAVEDAARCASVKATVCTGGDSTVSYAQAAYLGPTTTPAFVYSTPACGHQVSASATFTYNFVLAHMNVPMSAVSCFP
jgi:hypothetical protein